MNKEGGIKKIDILSYPLLLCGILLGVVAFLRFSYNSTLQLVVIVALVLYYFVWGAVYHLMKRDFSHKLMLEYLMISLICVGVGVLVFYL